VADAPGKFVAENIEFADSLAINGDGERLANSHVVKRPVRSIETIVCQGSEGVAVIIRIGREQFQGQRFEGRVGNGVKISGMIGRQSRLSIQGFHELDTLKVHFSLVPVVLCALQQHSIAAAPG